MPLGETAFGVVLWGATLAVFAAFVYGLDVVARDGGWLG